MSVYQRTSGFFFLFELILASEHLLYDEVLSLLWTPVEKTQALWMSNIFKKAIKPSQTWQTQITQT